MRSLDEFAGEIADAGAGVRVRRLSPTPLRGRTEVVEQARLLLASGARLPIVVSGPDAASVVAAAAGAPLVLLGAVVGLAGVDLSLYPGEVLAVIGDNGAGKSTLIKCLSGAMTPDQGTLSVDGKEVVFRRPQDARAAGIETEVSCDSRAIGKQLAYANRKGFRIALIAGENEFAQGAWQVKDLKAGQQTTVPEAELPAAIRQILG